jgi:hypothetical protein
VNACTSSTGARRAVARSARRAAIVAAFGAVTACHASTSEFEGSGATRPGQVGDGGGGQIFHPANPAGTDSGIAESVTCTAGTGSQCVPACDDGGATTLTGTVYDPAGKNPLYNVAVYIPNSPLPSPLPAGPACDCTGFFPTSIVASAVTGPDGRFVMYGVPVGKGLPLVVQAGKWRMAFSVDVTDACGSNSVADKSLRLPRNASEGTLPDIAISTGGADSLECLPMRIGVDPGEYVAGSSSAGHIHIFAGYAGATTAASTPQSPAALWDSTADLMKNDVVLLSCEGRETSGVGTSNQQSLLDYAAAGGRVFASHYHYVWFDQGPFGAFPLARWTTGPQLVVPGDDASVPADVVTTLPNGNTFPEGQALQQWLQLVGALQGGELSIWYARHNADVASTSMPVSQPWIALDPSVPQHANATQYLSFDVPIGASAEAVCGRVVYSDLHVSGGPGSDEPGVPPDYPDAGVIGTDRKGGIVPSGCASHPLTPQESALEFMLFDLSSCLVPIGGTPVRPR